MSTQLDVLEGQVLTALDRLGRVGVIGWVSSREVTAALPDHPSATDLDRAVRRLIRRGEVEVWHDRYPPMSAWHQAIRRVR